VKPNDGRDSYGMILHVLSLNFLTFSNSFYF
jgi:hypothetical protein